MSTDQKKSKQLNISLTSYIKKLNDKIYEYNLDKTEDADDYEKRQYVIESSVEDFFSTFGNRLYFQTTEHSGQDDLVKIDFNKNLFIAGSHISYIYIAEELIQKYISYYITMFKHKKEKASFYDVSNIFFVSNECHECGERVQYLLDFNDMTIKPRKTETCFMSKIEKTHSMELDLNSGKVLVANDMRELYGDRDIMRQKENDFMKEKTGRPFNSVNNRKGRILNTNFWSQQGLMYFQANDLSPEYFWNNEEKHIIFKNVLDDEVVSDKETFLDSVCTDLWAVQAMSIDTFKRLCYENKLDEDKMIKELDIEIHDVPKGIYTCTNYYELIEDNEDLNTYCIIQLKK